MIKLFMNEKYTILEAKVSFRIHARSQIYVVRNKITFIF